MLLTFQFGECLKRLHRRYLQACHVLKPATDGAQLTQAVVKAIEETHVLPKGALQLICGQTYDLLEQLGPQDCVTFTGSAYTGQKLRNHPHLNKYSIPFSMEADS